MCDEVNSMQYIPQNANDLAKEYMHRTEAAAQKNRLLASILEQKIRRTVTHLWMMLARLLHLISTEAVKTEVQEPLQELRRDPKKSRSYSL
jgi:hypothetical protein